MKIRNKDDILELTKCIEKGDIDPKKLDKELQTLLIEYLYNDKFIINN